MQTGTGAQNTPIGHVNPPDAFWSRPADAVMAEYDSGKSGLSSAKAAEQLRRIGPNVIGKKRNTAAFFVLLRQFRSPLVLILIFAAFIAALVGDGQEAIIITAIVLASCLLGFVQEYGASRAMEALQARVSIRATVIRDGKETTIPTEDIVPGDLMILSAGSLIAADGVIVEAKDFNVSEAALTGETFPVVKSPGVSAADAGLSQRLNIVYAGTSVRSGTARVVTVKTGGSTEFASIAEIVGHVAPETEFAAGIRRFGYMMTEIMLMIVIVVFIVNVLIHRPLVDSLLFSLALTVGLTPELLPAIISVTLSRGARLLAKEGVIVRRLEAIENLGSMDILCTDKTGTLTEGIIILDGCLDPAGEKSDHVLALAKLNSTLQTGLKNPLDEAIAKSPYDGVELAGYTKIDEIPYDFIRKALSVVVRPGEGGDDTDLLISKGALQNVLDNCVSVATAGGDVSLDDKRKADIDTRFRDFSSEGYRVLAVAARRISRKDHYGREDETSLVFNGFLLFKDPPKADIKETIASLHQRGIQIKMITGDNRYVAQNIATQVGLKPHAILTGSELAHMTKEALIGRVLQIDLFAEIDPNQKERIITSLRRHGHTVGYLGDGINDAPALHAADVGISVDKAVDVAREAADLILLKQDLGVLIRGIDGGRRAFLNTMKYISITTSANFGNMISMAFASLFLPFLPLLAKQILLNNFLSDLPSLAIASDNLDEDQMKAPRSWDIGYVRRFMISFGLVSSFFDFMTFGFLLYVVHASEGIFQTAWFEESLLTELAIVFIIRTRKAFWKSRPGTILSWLTVVVVGIAIALPISPVAVWFSFQPLPIPVTLGLVAITLLYLAASEGVKHWFFNREQHRRKTTPKVYPAYAKS